MTTIGNQDTINLLTTCIDNFFSNKENSHSFFVVSGPKDIDKAELIQNLIRGHLGQYFYHDFLWIRDLSDIICKKHSLKIETPKDKEDRYIQIDDQTTYEDIGVREINHRLQQSPLGKQKVVLLENIERIVPAAANAFLKNLEEPLPNRLIIATVSHQSQLLETILSRAIVIRFQSLLPQVMEAFEKENHETIEILRKSGHLVEKHTQLKKINESGILPAFIDGRIAYCVHHQLPCEKRLEAKKLINNNVNVENVLLYVVL